MDYKKAWEELKELIDRENILLTMNQLEDKYDDRYICTKDKADEFIKGNTYEIYDQDQNYVWVDGENDYHIGLTYDEFEKYFKERNN